MTATAPAKLDLFDQYRAYLDSVDIDVPVRDLATARDESTIVLLQAVQKCTSAEKTLQQLGEQVVATVTRVNGNLDANRPGSINSLGELQRTGQSYDQACTDLAAARDALAMIAQIWKSIH